MITRNMPGGICLIRVSDWVMVYANPQFESLFGYEAGELKGKSIVAVLQDVTEQKQAQEQITALLKEKEVLLTEIHHRVKNTLHIVKSLLQMQARRTQEQEATQVLQASQNRITSIALVHEKRYCSQDLANINFGRYIPHLWFMTINN